MRENPKGILILGLNGSGKSTLCHALAKELGWFEMDVEDYYFPEQQLSRQESLEGRYGGVCNHLGELPFSAPRSKQEAETALLRDLERHSRFILSGVTAGWRREILSCVVLAVRLQTPAQERVRRVEEREKARFGSRVLPGGDMFAQQAEFRKIIAERPESAVEQSMTGLHCPVLLLNGMDPVKENVESIKEQIRWHGKLSY